MGSRATAGQAAIEVFVRASTGTSQNRLTSRALMATQAADLLLGAASVLVGGA